MCTMAAATTFDRLFGSGAGQGTSIGSYHADHLRDRSPSPRAHSPRTREVGGVVPGILPQKEFFVAAEPRSPPAPTPSLGCGLRGESPEKFLEKSLGSRKQRLSPPRGKNSTDADITTAITFKEQRIVRPGWASPQWANPALKTPAATPAVAAAKDVAPPSLEQAASQAAGNRKRSPSPIPPDQGAPAGAMSPVAPGPTQVEPLLPGYPAGRAPPTPMMHQRQQREQRGCRREAADMDAHRAIKVFPESRHYRSSLTFSPVAELREHQAKPAAAEDPEATHFVRPKDGARLASRRHGSPRHASALAGCTMTVPGPETQAAQEEESHSHPALLGLVGPTSRQGAFSPLSRVAGKRHVPMPGEFAPVTPASASNAPVAAAAKLEAASKAGNVLPTAVTAAACEEVPAAGVPSPIYGQRLGMVPRGADDNTFRVEAKVGSKKVFANPSPVRSGAASPGCSAIWAPPQVADNYFLGDRRRRSTSPWASPRTSPFGSPAHSRPGTPPRSPGRSLLGVGHLSVSEDISSAWPAMESSSGLRWQAVAETGAGADGASPSEAGGCMSPRSVEARREAVTNHRQGVSQWGAQRQPEEHRFRRREQNAAHNPRRTLPARWRF
eukprot:TRINITY_DN19982_c0_g1_i1.p1 TRINITY_DN19982_c0_g1~~TRINITY_DN19982_c0_g1_i1.p1  ORF type:complete len:612 (-),score=92.90 TRINITY_DN19982_c0_g1_i1:52-1887(-)